MHGPWIAGKLALGFLSQLGSTAVPASLLVAVPVLAFSSFGDLPDPLSSQEKPSAVFSFGAPTSNLAQDEATVTRFNIPLDIIAPVAPATSVPVAGFPVTTDPVRSPAGYLSPGPRSLGLPSSGTPIPAPVASAGLTPERGMASPSTTTTSSIPKANSETNSPSEPYFFNSGRATRISRFR